MGMNNGAVGLWQEIHPERKDKNKENEMVMLADGPELLLTL